MAMAAMPVASTRIRFDLMIVSSPSSARAAKCPADTECRDSTYPSTNHAKFFSNDEKDLDSVDQCACRVAAEPGATSVIHIHGSGLWGRLATLPTCPTGSSIIEIC